MNEKNESNIQKCKICGKEAKSLCFNCEMYLCDSCYKFIHDKELNKDHKKEKIDYFVPIEIKCTEHPQNSLNLFCINDKGKNIYFLFIYY